MKGNFWVGMLLALAGAMLLGALIFSQYTLPGWCWAVAILLLGFGFFAAFADRNPPPFE